MKLDHKLNIVKRSIDSMATHTDKDVDTLLRGLQLIEGYCSDWRELLNAYRANETDATFNAPTLEAVED